MADVEIIKLAKKARRGDQNAFNKLCAAKIKLIIFNAYGILGNMQDAEDIAQETLVSMHKNIKNLRDPKAIDAWIMTIIRNHSSRLLQHTIPRKTELDVDAEAVANVLMEENREFLPETFVNDQAMASQLFDIIMELPDKRREMVIMFYYDDLSYKEIAQITDTSIKTVSTNIFRAKKAIKEKIAEKTGLELSDFVPDDPVGQAAGNSRKFALGATAASVLTQVLQQQEALLIQSERADMILAGATQAAVGIPLAGVLATISTKTVTAFSSAALTIAIAGGGATYVAVTTNDQAQEAASQSQIETTYEVEQDVAVIPVDPGGNVEFVGGTINEHTNPKEAALLGSSAPENDVTWEVYLSGGEDLNDFAHQGAPLLSGSGKSTTTQLPAFVSSAKSGNYIIRFTIDTEANSQVIKHRTFTVVSNPQLDTTEPDNPETAGSEPNGAETNNSEPAGPEPNTLGSANSGSTGSEASKLEATNSGSNNS